MLERLIAEATVCDFKEVLEVKKPKSWLKSVSAFANTSGGTLFFGIDNDHNIVGLADPQKDAEDISRLIKKNISNSTLHSHCRERRWKESPCSFYFKRKPYPLLLQGRWNQRSVYQAWR